MAAQHRDLTPAQLAECQRLFAASEAARQAYQDWLHRTLAAWGIDADAVPVKLNPWTGRFTLPAESSISEGPPAER